MQILAAAEPVTLTTVGAWTEVDLTAAPYNVPATASFALIHVVLQKTGVGIQGLWFRSAASAETNPGASGGSATTTTAVQSVVVPLSAGKFDYYSSSASITAAVIGYFSALDGTAFPISIDITPADPGYPGNHPLLEGWETIDVSALVPSTANIAVCSYHDTDFDLVHKHAFNARKTGTTELVANLDYAEGDGTAAGRQYHQYFLAPLTAAGKFDVYGNYSRSSGAQSRTLLIHGYLKAVENASPSTTDRQSMPASSSAYVDRTNSVSANAVLVYMTGPYGEFPKAGFRLNGETGAYSTAMNAVIMRGMTQAVVPLDVNKKWEQYIEYTGAWAAGYAAYTLFYFLTEELLEESATVADTLEQDLYTRETTETVAAADTVDAGDDYNPDAVAESAAAADAVVGDHAKGGVVGESAAPTDTVVADHTSTAAAGVPGDAAEVNVSGSGEGLFGASGSGAQPVDVAFTGEGETGDIGSGGGDVGVEGAGSGLHGGAATGEGSVSVTGSGTGAVVPAVEAEPAGQQYQTFAMNLLTGAVTQHSTRFNSRCQVGNKVYAAGPDGIHLIGGTTDAGVAIDWIIAKHEMDAGTRLNKRPTDCFLRVASTGNFDFTVFSERSSGTVIFTDGIAHLHASKANLPRGVSGSELGFTLKNRAGSELLSLLEIEFLLAVSAARRGRQVRA